MATPTASGTATPMELDPEQAALSLKVSLADLSAKATALYARKDYEGAAEVYAQAAEMQAEMNGEMNPDNAEILFLYGRALFKVGQGKSDVLGGKAPDTKKPKAAPSKKAKTSSSNGDANGGQNGKNLETKVDEVINQTADKVAKEAAKTAPAPEKKPLFQFEGDEDVEDSDEEAEEAEGGEEEEEEDDLAVAFEVLDLARLLFTKKLEIVSQPEPENDKGKEVSKEEEADNVINPAVRHIKERLGDTHDLLAEISLENERYPNAITDSRASLKYKQDLYPQESEIIAEAHFKLSLALEFASVTKSSDDNDDNDAGSDEKSGGGAAGTGVVDQSLRDEAASELAAAIASTKLKLQNKEVELATLHSPEDNEVTRQQIAEVKEIIADMEQRLADLRKPPIDIHSALGLPPPQAASGGGAGGVEKEVDEEVKRNANDLTGLVRKKRKIEESAAGGGEEGDKAKKVKEEGATVTATAAAEQS
ncbi:hypothetical protein QBC47DRAFT_367473 [Echria macrotheca]|uniref:Tetratricopeptide SHNi-TPR domain-containing protein n=1 Tax=Echria macrotheca TaxID=438768 RepID=A0AAJ0BLL8_9PEZI|nr:hypothetical protein QBC47DRAFT_367473 [Echria macrotheca]